MLDGRRPLQARHELRFGTRELVVFGVAFVLIWGLTFVFGILIGRELASPGGGKATGSVAARASLADAGRKGERPGGAGPDDRLTFYKTLTAPTPDLPPTQPSSTIEERLVPHEVPAKPPARPPAKAGRASSADSPAERSGVARRAATEAAPAPTPPAAAGEPTWTVQVSSFRSRALAEELRGRLAGKGFDAYLVSVTTEAGRVRHRVRVGAFSTRAEADRTAEELRAERGVNPFVTTQTR